MENKSIENLIHQVAKNGVGFRTLFFRMNASVDELFDSTGRIHANREITISFSDGVEKLGEFIFTPKMLQGMMETPCKPDDDEPVLLLSKLKNELNGILRYQEVYIKLRFNSVPGLYNGTAGTALINAF